MAVGFALAACAGGPGSEAASSGPAGSHHGQVDVIREAVVAGDVPATREPARWLSTHQGREYPAVAASSLAAMREQGRTMLAQTDILPVARTLGRMGVACAACHTALEARVKFPVELPPPTSTNLPQQMHRHAWAVDRLWEGLVGPSNASWIAGASALLGIPVDFGDNPQANRLAARVQDLAAQARHATTPERRADVYGDVLETCALCHSALRMRVR